MSVRAVLVVHREPIAAEALAATLGRYPALLPIGAASCAAEVETYAAGVDVAVVDERLTGSQEIASRLRRAGARVVLIGDASDGGDDEGVRVSVEAPVAQLASALVPGLVPRTNGSDSLSRREEQVLGLAARGLVAKQIASRLGISPKTVERHKSKIFRKLGVSNQAAAVALTAGNGSIRWSPLST